MDFHVSPMAGASAWKLLARHGLFCRGGPARPQICSETVPRGTWKQLNECTGVEFSGFVACDRYGLYWLCINVPLNNLYNPHNPLHTQHTQPSMERRRHQPLRRA